MLLSSYKCGVRFIWDSSANGGGVAINCDEFNLADNVRVLFQECYLILKGLFIQCCGRFRISSCLSNECFGRVVANKCGKRQICNTGASLVKNAGWVV